MAPTTIPPSFPASSFPEGQHAAATITISSDDPVVPPVAPAVIVLSSSSSRSGSVVNISSDDDDDATSRPAVVTGDDEAPRRRRRAAARRAASPPAAAQQQQQPAKRKYERWSLEDIRELLTVMADLRAESDGWRAPASEVLMELKLRAEEGAFSRPGVPVKKLSDKIRRLKEQFKVVHQAVQAGGNFNPRTKYRDGELYGISKNVWPELFQ